MTFSGLDGSGKSSQAKILCDELRKHGIDAVIEWRPVAYNPLIDRAKEMGNRILRLRKRDSGTTPAQQSAATADSGPGKALVRKSSVARHVWTTFIALTNITAHWSSVIRYGRTGRVVIFDRYVLDSVVRLHAWYEELGSIRFQTWLVGALSPRPFRAYLLDVPAETAFARRQDQWDLGQLRRQAALYRERSGSFGVRRLDGERPVEDLAREIAADVLGSLREDRR